MVKIYSQEQVAKIKQSGRILARILKILKNEAKIGISLKYLDNLAFRLAKESGAEPAFFNYQPDGAEYPYMASVCTSLNNVIVHGFPTDYKLVSGDVLKIDFGIKYKGYYSDSAATIIIGKSSPVAKNLSRATQKALEEAIKIAKPGSHLGDIGWAIEKTAKKYKVRVIKGLTGHGVGLNLHEDPIIYNYGNKGEGLELKAGMVLAIEPMFSVGTND